MVDGDWSGEDAQSTFRLGAPTQKPEELSLVVIAGPESGRSVDLIEGTVLVGTHPACGLVLTDPAVSRSDAWQKAANTEWTARLRPHFKDMLVLRCKKYQRSR